MQGNALLSGKIYTAGKKLHNLPCSTSMVCRKEEEEDIRRHPNWEESAQCRESCGRAVSLKRHMLTPTGSGERHSMSNEHNNLIFHG